MGVAITSEGDVASVVIQMWNRGALALAHWGWLREGISSNERAMTHCQTAAESATQAELAIELEKAGFFYRLGSTQLGSSKPTARLEEQTGPAQAAWLRLGSGSEPLQH